MISLLKVQLCRIGLSYFGSVSLFGNGESRGILFALIAFSDFVIFSFDVFLFIFNAPKNKIELSVEHNFESYFPLFFTFSFLLSVFIQLEKNSKSLKYIKILELLHKEKSLFKGKEGTKALKIMEEQGHRVGFGTQQFVHSSSVYPELEALLKTIAVGKSWSPRLV